MRTGLIAFFFLISKQSIAQEVKDTTALADVTVIAQRIAQPSVNIPYAVQKLDSVALAEKAVRTTAEALQGSSAVFVQKTNHGGGSPIIRGLTGNQTLILVDGIRLNNSTFRYGPNQYLATIDPYAIDHIEVLRGTGAVQYGSDALGGVIQVFSKTANFTKSKPNFSGRVVGKHMSGAMENTVRGEADYSGKKIAITTGISYRDFGDLIGGDTTGRQSPSGYKEWAFNAKLDFLIREQVKLTFAHQNLAQQNVPLYHKIKLENFAVNEFDKQQRQLQYAKLSIQCKRPIFQKLEITGAHQQTNEGRESSKNGSALLQKEHDVVNTLSVAVQLVSVIKTWWSATSGVELYKDRVNSSRLQINTQSMASVAKRGLYPDGATTANYSVYSLHHFRYKKWVMDAGVRLNTFDVRLKDTSLGEVQLQPSALVGNIALLYAIGNNKNGYINYSTGFRAPNIDDLGSLGVVDFRYEIPTANLKPEQSANLEIGYKMNNSKWVGNVALYQLRLSQLISRVKLEGMQINSYQVYRKENIENAVIKGAEADIEWKPLNVLSVRANITYTHGENKSKAEPLRRIPPLFGSMATSFRGKNWYATVEGLLAGKQSRLAQGDKDDNRITATGTPAWEVLNMYMGASLQKHTIRLGVQNIFDRDYRTHGSGINGVGRSVWISASFAF